MLPRLFRLFSQGRQIAQGGSAGLGIGLSLVDRLVQLHGGQVSAHSEGPGKGSEFIVQLPVCDRQHAGTAAPSGMPQGLQDSWWSERSVLVVDDNVDAANTLSSVLGALGAHVRTVHDGPDAIAAASQALPAIALLDIGMPMMDGYQLARRLRDEHAGGDLILIALTGWGQQHDRDAALAAGFDYHWVKPVNLEQLQGFRGRETLRH
jgi:CheY-like chemotaxis protein